MSGRPAIHLGIIDKMVQIYPFLILRSIQSKLKQSRPRNQLWKTNQLFLFIFLVSPSDSIPIFCWAELLLFSAFMNYQFLRASKLRCFLNIYSRCFLLFSFANFYLFVMKSMYNILNLYYYKNYIYDIVVIIDNSIMGKGGKNNQQQQSKKRRPEPEPSQDEPEVQLDEAEQQQEQMDYFDPELSDRDQELLQRINQEIVGSADSIKMTWAAIHKIKEEQKKLNEKMDEEMVKIQQKYDELKNPLINKIAKIASGQVFEKQLYTQHELTKSLSINKNKPQAIPGFWKNTLESVGFIQNDDDATILDSCTHLEVSSDRKLQGQIPELKIKAVFQLSTNDFISNKELKIQVHRKGDEITKSIPKVNFKKSVSEDSVFHTIFNTDVSPEELLAICEDLLRAYNNSVFYYFYQGKLLDQEQGNEEQDEDEQDEGEDQDSEQEVPQKKSQIKGKGGKKQEKPAVEKPECKNQ